MTIQPEAPETEGRSGLSRRTVIKAGAHAAWMVPAITVITTAPAFATGSNDPVLGLSGTSASWAGSSQSAILTIKFTITNTGVSPTSGVQATLAFEAGGAGQAAYWVPKNQQYTSVDSGWSIDTSGKASPKFTFVGVGQVQGSANSPNTKTFTATFSPGNSGNALKKTVVDLSVFPGAGGGSSVGTTISTP